MKILAIETSCDETSAAVIEDGRRILSNQIYTQIDLHKKYGGVVPEIASRNHVVKLPYIIDAALEEAQCDWDQIDAFAVANGPGLVGALLVGVSHGKALAYALNKPLIGVNHIMGHIAANFLEFPDLEPPFLALVTSGGHSNLILVSSYADFEVLGKTRDDAAGEAYDKIARVLGFPYPGGPCIDQAAQMGDPEAIFFPRPVLNDHTAPYDFSFSGLKSAVLNYLNACQMKDITVNKNDVAAGFQQAVIDVVVEKTMRCAEENNMNKIVLAGGVSANRGLRSVMTQAVEQRGMILYYPSPVLCTDNAAMIGAMAYYDYQSGKTADWTLNADPAKGIGNFKLKEKGPNRVRKG